LQGYPHAKHNLAYCYEDQKKEKEALQSYLEAANAGYCLSQNRLAQVYYYAKFGQAKNRKEAMKWYELAAKQGDKEAKKQYQALKAQNW